MSRINLMKALFNERFSQAADEVFGVLGKTITEYEDEVTLYKNEIYRLRIVVENLKVEAKSPVNNADPPQYSTFKDEVPPEQQPCERERSFGLTQEEPDTPQIKQEPEELWTSPTGQLLQRLEDEADPLGDPSPSTISVFQMGLDDPVAYVASEPPSDGSVDEHQDSDEDWTLRGKRLSGRRSKRRSPRSSTAGSIKEEMSSRLKPGSSILYSCKVCGEQFSSKGLLLSHAKNHNCVEACVCGVCGVKLDTADSLKCHLHTHRTCDFCGKGFPTSQRLDVHIRIHTGEKPFTCRTCGQQFNQRGSLRRHITRHKGKKPYSCKHCGAGFKYLFALEQHVKTHSVKITKATNQTKSLNDNGVPNLENGPLGPTPLPRPEPTHKDASAGSEPPRDYPPVAGFQNRTGSEPPKDYPPVAGYQNSDRSESPRDYPPVPGYQNSDRSEPPRDCPPVASYQNSDRSEPPRDCPPVASYQNSDRSEPPRDCPPVASYQNIAGEQDWAQSGERLSGQRSKSSSPHGFPAGSRKEDSARLKPGSSILYSCKVCGEQFSSKGLLLSHAKNHNCVEACVCGVCGVKLDTADSLKCHLHTHRTCDFCGKSFPTSQRLDVHIRIHTGEKPFTCRTCGQQFNQRGSLRRHITRHKGKKPYSCKHCGDCFRYLSNLKQHVKLHNVKRVDAPKQRILLDCTQLASVRKAEGELNRDSLDAMEGTG